MPLNIIYEGAMELFEVEANIDYTEFHNVTKRQQRAWKVKKSKLSIRNDFDSTHVILCVPNKFKSNEVAIKRGTSAKLHTKFLKEGKATIRLPAPLNTIIMLNGADPHKLALFLIAFSEVVNGRTKTSQKKLRSPGKENKSPNPIPRQRSKTFRGTKTPPRIAHLRNIKSKQHASNPEVDLLTLYRECRKGLDVNQKRVLQLVTEGENVFFTGSAGCGKSFLLHNIIRLLPKDTTAVTSSTGISAVQIHGSTLHNWVGVNILDLTTAEAKTYIFKRRQVLQRWLTVRTLIVDEISMVDGRLFQKIEELAREVRGNSKPFGGIQLVICGDFFQLPPVEKGHHVKRRFCFESSSWKTCFGKGAGAIVQLQRVYRQNDDKFVSILEELRVGKCSVELEKFLTDTCKPGRVNHSDGILPTVLVTRNLNVKKINQEQLSKLEGPPTTIHAIDTSISERSLKQLSSNCRAPSELNLKIGAQVMLVKNLAVEQGLCNGSRGVVVSFKGGTKNFPEVQFSTGVTKTLKPERFSIRYGGVEVASRTQVPLTLAWALSIHKSQGMSLDRCRIFLSSAFEFGHVYVALSRCKSLDGLEIEGFDRKRVKAHPAVLHFYAKLADQEESKKSAQELISPASRVSLRPSSSVRA